jgi:hypothetical protein
MNINFNKTKEMVIGTLSNSPPPVISINNNTIQRVTNFKLLGVTLDRTIKWHSHINLICNKASSRLYFLKQLRRNHVKEDDLFIFYTAFIRPVVEYACPAWHSSLTIEQSNRIEQIQKRAMTRASIHIDECCMVEHREIGFLPLVIWGLGCETDM